MKKSSSRRLARRPTAANKKPNHWKTAGKWLLIGIAGRELYLALGPRRQNRRDRFNEAQYRAKQTGKPLIVIGDPDGGMVNRFIGRDYECASLCIDTHGCLKCEKNTIGKLEEVLPTLGNNSAVVFVSTALEYVQDMDRVSRELYRVSGGDLFVVPIERWTLTSILSGTKRQLFEAPPLAPRLRWKDHYWSGHRSATPVFPANP
jgi:hypothetical protein